MFKFSKSSLKKMSGVHPFIIAVMVDAVGDSPYDFGIDSGVRTVSEQQKLYAQGRTTSGAVVTNCDGVKNKSNHQTKDDGLGYAMDIKVYVDGKITWEQKYFNSVSKHILGVAKKKGVSIEWGGNWKSKDSPHFELTGV
ncbi:MAG: M15 family metallopeptidase [Cetobacterium sp.]